MTSGAAATVAAGGSGLWFGLAVTVTVGGCGCRRCRRPWLWTRCRDGILGRGPLTWGGGRAGRLGSGRPLARRGEPIPVGVGRRRVLRRPVDPADEGPPGDPQEPDDNGGSEHHSDGFGHDGRRLPRWLSRRCAGLVPAPALAACSSPPAPGPGSSPLPGARSLRPALARGRHSVPGLCARRSPVGGQRGPAFHLGHVFVDLLMSGLPKVQSEHRLAPAGAGRIDETSLCWPRVLQWPFGRQAVRLGNH